MAKQASARSRRSIDALPDIESTKRALCTRIFEDPLCIVDVLGHEVTGPLSVKAHTHTDLLQLDLIAGCTGKVVVGDQQIQVSRTTLMSAYPGQLHGYDLLPGDPPSEVWLVKIRLPKSWRNLNHLPLPSILTGLPPQNILLEGIVSFATYWAQKQGNPIALAHLARTLAAWPSHAADLPCEHLDPLPAQGDSAVSRMRRVIQANAKRASDPPTLDELAASAGLSSRHFARLFKDEFGCTPHTYLSSQRLDAARRLLLTPGVSAAQAAEQLGFTTPSAFSRWFTHMVGKSPRRFREDPSTF